MATRNTLNLNQMMALTAWLKVHHADITARGLTKPEAAAEATKALGFTVTEANLNKPLEALGLKWGGGAKPNEEMAKAVAVLADVSTQLADISKRMRLIEEAVEDATTRLVQPSLFSHRAGEDLNGH